MTKAGNSGTFPLRLPHSVRRQAIEIANIEGISLNQFITLALAEKMARIDAVKAYVEPHMARVSPGKSD